MKTLFLCSGLLFLTLSAFAQDKEEKHPIDKFVDDCIDKNPSTHGTMGCFDQGYKKWDAELNKVYKQLAAKLTPEQKTGLQNAQREWIKFRDAEFKSIDLIYGSMQGTMFQPMNVSDKMEVVKQRAIDLQSYLDLLGMN